MTEISFNPPYVAFGRAAEQPRPQELPQQRQLQPRQQCQDAGMVVRKEAYRLPNLDSVCRGEVYIPAGTSVVELERILSLHPR